MYKIPHLIFISGMLLATASCRPVEQNPAKATATRFLDYFHQHEFERAAVYLDTSRMDDFYGYLSYLDLGYDSLAGNFQLDTIIYSEAMDTATIYYSGQGIENNDYTLRMVKSNDQWRVLFSRSDPAATAERFLKAFYARDIDGAKKFATPHSYPDLEFLLGHQPSVDTARAVQVDIFKVEWDQHGNKAMVQYTENEGDRPVKLNLVKMNGMWRVNLALDKLDGYQEQFFSYSRNSPEEETPEK